ncbi:MAG: hypothetical protein ABIQ74_07075, partial [Chitinophagales bacterium]
MVLLKNNLLKQGLLIIFLVLFISAVGFSQQPKPQPNIHPQQITPVYLLSITPRDGGKAYTLFHKTKVMMRTKDGRVASGKVFGIGRDSIAINSQSFAIRDIDEVSFNPGSITGVIAAIATTAGLLAIAITIDSKDPSTDAILYGGIGLAIIGGAVLIPTYFLKKHFTTAKYEFTPV